MSAADHAEGRGGIGIGWVYGLAYVALALVLVSLLGNLLASVSHRAELGSFIAGNYIDLLSNGRLLAVTLRTLAFGAGAVAVMMGFALPIAWLVSRTDFRWKKIALGLLVAKLAIPGFITAMSYVWLFNPTSGLINAMFGATALGATPVFDIYGLGWICYVQGIVLVPACVFLMLPAFGNLDGTLEEAAWASGITRRSSFRKIVLPLLAPAILGSAFFFFVISIESFDIVGLIGLPGRIEVLSLWIYDALHPSVGLPDYGYAGAIGMVLFAVAGIAIGFYVRMLRRSERYAVLGGKGRAAPPQALGGWRWAALAFVLVWAVVAFLVPILTLVWVSLVPYLQPPSIAALGSVSLQSFGFALQYLRVPALNTLIVGLGAIVLVLAWSLSVCWVVTRSGSRSAAWVDSIVFLSPAVPSMVAAVAFQYLGIALYKWLPLYGSIWLVTIVMSTRLVAFCTRTMNAAAWQIHAQLDEAAYVSGVSRFGAFRHVFLPILAPAVFYSAVIVALLSMRELTVPLMINTGNAPLVSTLVFDLQMNGSHNVAAAISVYMIVFLVAMTFAASRLARIDEPIRVRHGRRRAAKGKIRLAAASLLLAALCCGGARAIAQPATALSPQLQALLAPAKAEGGLTVYGISANPDEEKIFAKGISAFRGFDVNLKMVSGLHPQKVAELVVSTKQGVPSGLDVFWTAAVGGNDLDQAGAVMHVDWEKEFGVDPKLLWGRYGLRAQDGTLIIVMYNKNLVPEAQAPKRYEDLLNPIYKGRIAIPRAPGIFAFLGYYLGEDKTVALVKGLMEQQQSRLLATFPDVLTRVSSGEFAIGVGMDAFSARRKGAPVDNAPIDPVIVTPWASHVMKDARSPNLAKLWSYWLTTPEGQTAMDQARAISRYDAPGTELWKLAQGRKVIVVPADFTIEQTEHYNAVIGPIMGLGR